MSQSKWALALCGTLLVGLASTAHAKDPCRGVKLRDEGAARVFKADLTRLEQTESSFILYLRMEDGGLYQFPSKAPLPAGTIVELRLSDDAVLKLPLAAEVHPRLDTHVGSYYVRNVALYYLPLDLTGAEAASLFELEVAAARVVKEGSTWLSADYGRRDAKRLRETMLCMRDTKGVTASEF